MPNKICKEKTKKDIVCLRKKIITYKDQKHREKTVRAKEGGIWDLWPWVSRWQWQLRIWLL